MSESSKSSIDERVERIPFLRERFESILDLAENVDGKFATADEAEPHAIEQLRCLGNELLHAWAIKREKQTVEQLTAESPGAVSHGKKTLLENDLRQGITPRTGVPSCRACHSAFFTQCPNHLSMLFNPSAAARCGFWR